MTSVKEKTKKEHYVPRCYLNRWGNEKKQVYVYDKKANNNWKCNINDVACERFFYDIEYKELDTNILDFLHENGIKPEEDAQFIEHFFSEQVENEYSKLLQEMMDKETTPWYEQNCFFISREAKLKLSICLVYQYIRTKALRNTISNLSNCMEQWLQDMNCNSEMIDKYTIKPGEENLIQGGIMFNFEHITHMTKAFFELSWLLRINKTSIPFLTSDNPIGTYPHVRNLYLSMSGISSPGVEVFMPLSPRHLLVMYDGNYHTNIKLHDRRFVEINDIEVVNWYNRLCIYNSEQYIISSTDNANDISKIISKESEIIMKPKISLTFGGKSYVPQ